MTLARKAEGYPESPSSRNLKAITMEQRCHFTAVTAMAALQLKVRFHVPGVLFLVIDFLGACFTPKKDRALKHAMFTDEVVFQWPFVSIRCIADFTVIYFIQDKRLLLCNV